MEVSVNFLNGIQTTFEWIIVAVVAAAVIAMTVIIFVRRHNKWKKSHATKYEKLIEEEKSQESQELTEDDYAWLEIHHKRQIDEGRHLIHVKGTNVQW